MVSRTGRQSCGSRLKLIQDELNESEGGTGDDSYREKIEAKKMPDEVRKKALAEARKLETGGPHNHEGSVIRNYLDLILDLPWETEEKKSIDIEVARKVLESHHNGLEKVKERVIQHLAVMKLKSEKQGSILLFSGPPVPVRRASERASQRRWAGNMSASASAASGTKPRSAGTGGHTSGPCPGGSSRASRRPDKEPGLHPRRSRQDGLFVQRDPASALLEVLDPERTTDFSDHYLEVPYDLSDVLFIATANSLATIPPPLLDRMELIEISGYTKNEKFAIAKDHLIPEVLKEHGLDEDKLRFDDEALKVIIDTYTREAGVRWLKKQLAKAARHVSEKIVSGKAELPFSVTTENVAGILGKEPVRHEMARKEPVPGVITGLAWTPVGGEILFIESTFMPGKGKLTLTGQLGDVMKESATISLSLIRSRLARRENGFNFTTSDIHIHVPSGATPKDGPSAGVTLFTSLASLITGKTVDPLLAMTGEITLSGAVMPVGGIRRRSLPHTGRG